MKEFPPFRLDTVNQCLWRRMETGNDERILLTPKAFSVLKYLVDRAGQLVTRDELLDAVWSDAHVGSEVLNKQIVSLRNILGDQPKKPIYIETQFGSGFRFIAPIRDAATEANLVHESFSTKLVGRQTALASLQNSLGKALRDQRQIVFLTGEPGIGKTSLADEFQRQTAIAVPGMRIVRSQCVEGYGGKEPYYPMLQALTEWCKGGDADSVVQTLASQAPTWLVQLPSLIKREDRDMLHHKLLGATRERMLREIGEALEAITAGTPLLLVFEDLHWVDPSTVDLISALARRRGPAKLMMLGTYRPADIESSSHPLRSLTQDLLVHRLCCEIALEPLTETEVAEYLTSEISGIKAPESLAALLYRHSEGNPLFMVAALEHLSERGLISRQQGALQDGVSLEKIDLEVPESLRRMIEAQIERLGAEEQRVLEVASLESIGGSQFAAAARAQAIDMEPEAFDEVCETLSRRRSIVRSTFPLKLPDGMVTPSYEFVHVLYREVCYRRMTQGRRARLHRRIGEWAEEHWGRVEEAAVWLAGHFEQAEDWPRVVKYLQVAAETAGRRYEPRRSAEILERSLQLVKKLPEMERANQEITILEKLAAVYAATGDLRAIETCEALAARAAEHGLVDEQERALIGMANSLTWISSERWLTALEQALRLSAKRDGGLLQAETRARCFVRRLWMAWNPQDAEEFRKAFAEISNAEDRRVLAPYLADNGFISWISSEYREARRNLLESRVLLLAAPEENPYLNAVHLRAQFPLVWSLLFLGEWGEALRESENTITLLDRNDDYYAAHVFRLSRAWVHFFALDFAGTLAICNSVFPLVKDSALRPAPGHQAPYRVVGFWLYLLLKGAVETALGNHENALEHLLEAQADMDRSPVMLHWFWRMPLASSFTELWLAKGDLIQARLQADSFLKSTLATVERTWQVLAWEVSARVAMAEFDQPRAQDCVSNALCLMEGLELPLATWRVHATAAELYRRMNLGDLAKHHLALSRENILKLASSLPEQEPLRQKFLSAPIVCTVLGDYDTHSSPFNAA